MDGIELLVFIIARGRGDELIRLASEHRVSFRLLLHGRGTADSEILSMLGLSGPDKDVVLLSVERKRSDEIMDTLAKGMGIGAPGVGVAFAIPFSAAASQFMSYELLAGTIDKEREEKGIKHLADRLVRRQNR